MHYTIFIICPWCLVNVLFIKFTNIYITKLVLRSIYKFLEFVEFDMYIV